MHFDPNTFEIFFSRHMPMASWTLTCRQVVVSSLSAVLRMVFCLKHQCDMLRISYAVTPSLTAAPVESSVAPHPKSYMEVI